MCVAHSRNRDSLLWITVLKPSWLTEQWVRQETEEQGALFFVRQCVFGAAPANKPPSVYEFSLSSWLSPGRPALLAEECMGVGFFNKGNSLFLEAPRKPWALLFMVSLLCSSKVGYLLVLLLFKQMALPWGWDRKTEKWRGSSRAEIMTHLLHAYVKL